MPKCHCDIPRDLGQTFLYLIVENFRIIWNWSFLCTYFAKFFFDPSIANSSLFPTFMYLHSNSTRILALKKISFFSLFRVQKIKKKKICKKGIMQLFSADTIVFSKKKHIMKSRYQTSVLLSVAAGQYCEEKVWGQLLMSNFWGPY